jgi:CBS domain-containing protein
MKVREIMTTEVESAVPDSTLAEIAGMMRDEDVGAIPVVDGDELVGIITDRDIVVRCIADGKDPADLTAEEIIRETPQVISPEDDVEQASRLMAQRQIRRLPVVQDGQLVGMLSIGDIAVKHGDEQVAAETLDKVSRGVKGEGRKAEPAGIAKGAEREQGRKQRVVPIRAHGKRAAQGKKASRRKAS